MGDYYNYDELDLGAVLPNDFNCLCQCFGVCASIARFHFRSDEAGLHTYLYPNFHSGTGGGLPKRVCVGVSVCVCVY